MSSQCFEVFATCPGDNTDPTQAKMHEGEVVKTQQVANTAETAHTHNASSHESYEKWMELYRTATRNRETKCFNLCANSYGWFRAGSDLATGFILGLQLLLPEMPETPETRQSDKKRQTRQTTNALRPCTSTRVHPSRLCARFQ